MSTREIVALGTSSQVPTKARNHVSTLVRLGGATVMVDCGEGTQRQMQHAHARTSQLDLMCLTHEHGDHTFGVPGVLQRRRLDGETQPLPVVAPAGSIARLSLLTDFATAGPDPLHTWIPAPASDHPVEVARLGSWSVRTASLRHRVPTVGYQFIEDDGNRIVPERLGEAGVAGPEIARLQQGEVIRGVTLADVSVPRRGQRIAVVMDTALCAGASRLAQDCDVLVCEATYLDAEEALAAEHLHLTARQAAELAVEANVKRLVLTHFSSRYDTLDAHEKEAATHPDVVVARDLDTIPFPPRRGVDAYGRNMPLAPLPDDVRERLARPNPAVMATIHPEGYPVTVATWYLLEPDGRILLNLDAGRARLEHIRANPQISLTALDEESWYTHISVQGPVTEITDDPDLKDIDRLSIHYGGEPYRVRDRARVSVRMTIERWHGWGAARQS